MQNWRKEVPFAREAAALLCHSKARSCAGLKASVCAWTRRARVSWWSAWCPADSRVPIMGALLRPRHNSPPPAHLLAHSVGNEGSSLLRFCFVEGTDPKGHLHTQRTRVAYVCRGRSHLRATGLGSAQAPAASTASRCISSADRS